MDIWGTLKDALKVGAPILANAIVPGAGGIAASLVSSVLGVSDDDPDAMLQAIQQASPEQWAELRKVQEENRVRLVEIAADLEKAFLLDRQDARSRDTKMKLAGHHNYRADVMLTLAFIAILTILWIVYQQENITKEVFGFLNLVAGSLLKMIGDAFHFEFGSSRGSKEKDLKLPRV